MTLRVGSANHRFKFDKRRQYFIRTDNEALLIAAMRVSNEDYPPVGVHPETKRDLVSALFSPGHHYPFVS